MAKRTCSIEGCDKPYYVRGWCTTHHSRWLRHGDPTYLVPRILRDSRWTDANGYVRIRRGGVMHYEHRYVWEQANGPIPDGFHIHHRNHVRDDNRLDNLALVDGRVHTRRHTTERHEDGDLNNRGVSSVRYRSDLDDEVIARMRDEGLSFREIGRRLGATHNTISNHYRRYLAGQGNR